MECKKAILAVINPTYVVVEIRPEKIPARTGFEPIIFAMPVSRRHSILKF